MRKDDFTFFRSLATASRAVRGALIEIFAVDDVFMGVRILRDGGPVVAPSTIRVWGRLVLLLFGFSNLAAISMKIYYVRPKLYTIFKYVF